MKRTIALAISALLAFFALPVGGLANAVYKTADIDAGDAFRNSVTWTGDGASWSAYDEAAYYEFQRIAAGQRKGEMQKGLLLYVSLCQGRSKFWALPSWR